MRRTECEQTLIVKGRVRERQLTKTLKPHNTVGERKRRVASVLESWMGCHWKQPVCVRELVCERELGPSEAAFPHKQVWGGGREQRG